MFKITKVIITIIMDKGDLLKKVTLETSEPDFVLRRVRVPSAKKKKIILFDAYTCVPPEQANEYSDEIQKHGFADIADAYAGNHNLDSNAKLFQIDRTTSPNGRIHISTYYML